MNLEVKKNVNAPENLGYFLEPLSSLQGEPKCQKDYIATWNLKEFLYQKKLKEKK
jgi:hypothetical protein